MSNTILRVQSTSKVNKTSLKYLVLQGLNKLILIWQQQNLKCAALQEN